MDEPLRVGLWNALLNHQFRWTASDPYSYGPTSRYPLEELKETCFALWRDYFKRPLDTIPAKWERLHAELREYFFGATWNEAYDFIEFVPRSFPRVDVNAAFYAAANEVLEREMSAYRFVSGSIVRITERAEMESIESAKRLPRKLDTVAQHFERALSHLSDRKSPDYRNSIKESISAVEGMCALITGQEKSDLSAALRQLEQHSGLHGALKSAFNSLYGFTSDSNGIRHALLDEATLSFDDAKFMLVACSAFVNYLKSLIEKGPGRH